MAETILNNFTSTVRKAVDEYHMIEEGDKIAVGISGGKDSMLLLASLHHLSTFYPYHFDVEAVTIDLGFEGMDFTPVQEYCDNLGIRYVLEKTDIREIVFDIRQEDNPCALCAKMRRGALNNIIKTHGFTKLALGHHFDDAVETIMMNLFIEGRFDCFRPVTYLSRSDITVIRPMLYVPEKEISHFVRVSDIAPVPKKCPADGITKREDTKKALAEMERKDRGVKQRIFNAWEQSPVNRDRID